MTIYELLLLIWSWLTLKKDQLSEEEYLMEQERINSLLKETGKRVLIISLRLVSVLLSAGVLWYLVKLFYQKFPVATIIGIVIICLVLVSALSNNKNKCTKTSTVPVHNPNAEILDQNAKNGYRYMRTIMIKVIREVAVDIGAIVPRSPNEIEVLSKKVALIMKTVLSITNSDWQNKILNLFILRMI